MKATIDSGKKWFATRGWSVLPFQRNTWKALLAGRSGLINAPTGSGKTYSLLVPFCFDLSSRNTEKKGLRLIWISPIRALTKEIESAARRLIDENNLKITVGVRTGDTSLDQRNKQKNQLPDILITTPESLHLLLASKNASHFFQHLEVVVADEWHELLGTKRGVQLELALSRLKSFNAQLRVWGISATIGNLKQAMEVLLGVKGALTGELILSRIKKKIQVVSIMPEKIETLPWAGHLGSRLVAKVVRIISGSNSTLIFTNVRSQCEAWYKMIISCSPELSGAIAIHHGSLDKSIRNWVEDSLGQGKLKAVVCTSSLDLGVDFGAVDTIIQVGGPKGVSRFVQRAGRSGHNPNAASHIYFLPSHSLELIEACALRQAIKEDFIESKEPCIRCFDVLVQYLVTLAVGEGFRPEEVFSEISNTYCFESITQSEWKWVLSFISSGGESLRAYPEFQKISIEEGVWKIASARIARRHRLSMGTIVGDTLMNVKFKRSGTIGFIEESFISSLNIGDAFWFAGYCLELVSVKEFTAFVKPSTKKDARIPAWLGGRLPLSSRMSHMLRRKLTESISPPFSEPELSAIQPIIQHQKERSIVPTEDQFLIEKFVTDDGFHFVFFPFEGRFVHEGLASVIAYRISQHKSISFSLAYNDYGFELLCDQDFDPQKFLELDVFSEENLERDVLQSINATEMANRRFREIAVISGLIFRGFPGQPIKERHLQSSSQLMYKVFMDYDPQNLLLKQAYDEVIHYQLEIVRMRQALKRIASQEIVITYPEKPTPLAFPIMVDRLRAKLTSESLEERIRKMTL